MPCTRSSGSTTALGPAPIAQVPTGCWVVPAMARMRPMNLTITPFVFRLHEAFEPVLSDEVRSVHWLPLGELLGTARRSTMDYAHQGESMQFPCLRIDEVVIWGLTYRMFMGFQERFGISA